MAFFESWRYKKQRKDLVLKLIFDTAAKAPLGREAVDYINDNNLEVVLTPISKRVGGDYSSRTKRIRINYADKGDARVDFHATTLVHEARHAWQHKNGLLHMRTIRPTDSLTVTLLTEADTYSLQESFNIQRRHPGMTADMVRNIRAQNFFALLSDPVFIENITQINRHLNPPAPVRLFYERGKSVYHPVDYSRLGQVGFYNKADRYLPKETESFDIALPQNLQNLILQDERKYPQASSFTPDGKFVLRIKP